MINPRVPILALFALCFALPCHASLSISLPKGEEKCFVFRTPGEGPSHITGSFDLLDDDVSANPVTSTLFDDNYEVLWHSDQGTTEGSFIAHGVGRYHLCFGNGSGGYKTNEDREKERLRVEGHHIDDDNFDYQNYDGKDRHIAFNVRVRPEIKPYNAKDGANAAEKTSDRVLGMATRLKDKLDLLMDHQDYIKNREMQHRDIMEKTYSLLMRWTVLEALVLIFVATAQVLYFRKFFETKRYL